MLPIKLGIQKTLYCATSNNLCFCTTWQNGETQKAHFSFKCYTSGLPEFQPVTAWFLQSFWLMTHTHAAVWVSKSCIQCVQLGVVGRHGSGERNLTAPQQLHVHQWAVFLKEKNSHLLCVRQCLTFVEIVRHPINTVHWLSLQAWWGTTPIFYTAIDTVTDLVNIERVGNRQQDAMLPF